ncbi:MAG: ABC transporter ATP-binding protein [Candidatus Eremiobacteraeota bacterium]|nr:ABC transporter ATP-binding protein [Candidatus Eremiobacteraeota bacterium]MBV8365336.1 ABC transporter ATP-binding protein [Candidatus Eremiobacteraeota bacterium]
MFLEARELNTYYGKSHVLQDVSVDVDRGEVVALIGRNGSGRSTTLKTIAGVTPPKRGSVTLDGRDITGMKPYTIARQGVAYVPEERRIFPNLTVLENLKLATLAGRKGRWDYKKVFAFFPRLDERKTNAGKSLSGGEQQMLTIARALIQNPDIILLDEPLEGLAPVVAQAIQKAIMEMKAEGMTMLLVEQNARVALAVSDRAHVLSDGRIVASGTSAQLRDDQELVQRYLSV